MAVSKIMPYNSVAPSAAYQSSARTPGQSAHKTEARQAKADKVELSGAALARSLRSQGYSTNMISLKMGLNIKTVNGYLGITKTSLQSETKIYEKPKTSYVEPKTTYVEAKPAEKPEQRSGVTEPKTTYAETTSRLAEPDPLTQNLENLTQTLINLPVSHYLWSGMYSSTVKNR